MHLLSMIAIGAVAVVAVGWLAVSFLGPTAGRRKLEWIAATALYVALFSFFVNLVRRAVAEGSETRMIAFGFLMAMFGIGLLVCTVRTVGVLRGRVASKQGSATH